MCFGSGGGEDVDQEAALKNREIEKLIRADQKRAAREVKLLLLGELNHIHSVCKLLFESNTSKAQLLLFT